MVYSRWESSYNDIYILKDSYSFGVVTMDGN